MKQNHNKDVPAASVAKATPKPYNNNPIMIAVAGIERIMTYAKPVAITLLIASLLIGLSTFLPSSGYEEGSVAGESGMADVSPLLAIVAVLTGGFIGLIVLGIILAFGILLVGIVDYVAAAAADGRKTTLRDAFEKVLANYWPYAKMRLLYIGKLFLWTLLFIVPGIYFYNRYKLSGIAFFSEGKRGNAAIKRSLALTKDAWLTTAASYSFLNIITLGMVQLLADTGTGAELYRNYRSTVDNNQKHPRAHGISWLLLSLVVGLIVLAAVFAAFISASGVIPTDDIGNPETIQTESV